MDGSFAREVANQLPLAEAVSPLDSVIDVFTYRRRRAVVAEVAQRTDERLPQKQRYLRSDCRRSITDGITRSDKFVSFLSKHSTRDPGVCRDEIAIAIGVKGGNIQTILVESEQQVQPPASIGHIQWLDMHDWKERQARARRRGTNGISPNSPRSSESWRATKAAQVVGQLQPIAWIDAEAR